MDELSLITLAAAKSYTDEHGGGGGGTSNYNDLSNKPQIGGVTLSGNKSASDLGLVAAEAGKGLSKNDYTNADKAIVGGVTAALADKADKSAVKNEFIGTLAQWNALTTEQKKAHDTYQITDDYTAGGGGLPDYSTTEQLTGQKWIDGKDIYFKVVSITTDAQHGEKAYSLGLQATDNIIDYRAIMNDTSGKVIQSGYFVTSSDCFVTFIKEDNTINMVCASWGLGQLVNVIVYYTKTT